MSELKSSKFGLNTWEVVLFISALFLLIFLSYRMIKSKLSKPEEEEEEEPEPEPEEKKPKNRIEPEGKLISGFYKTVVDTLPEIDNDLKLFITAQAMHESGMFASPLYMEHNNAFGMKFPQIRPTVAEAQTETGYAHYSSPAQSIKDLSLWLEYVNAPEKFDTASDYVDFIKQKGYFTDSQKTYTNAVVKHLANLKQYAQ